VKAEARRHHTHGDLAERSKNVSGASPITEELGENRGS